MIHDGARTQTFFAFRPNHPFLYTAHFSMPSESSLWTDPRHPLEFSIRSFFVRSMQTLCTWKAPVGVYWNPNQMTRIREYRTEHLQYLALSDRFWNMPMSLCGHQQITWRRTYKGRDTTGTLPSTNVGDASWALNDADTPGRRFIIEHHDLLAMSNMHVQALPMFLVVVLWNTQILQYSGYGTSMDSVNCRCVWILDFGWMQSVDGQARCHT